MRVVRPNKRLTLQLLLRLSARKKSSSQQKSLEKTLFGRTLHRSEPEGLPNVSQKISAEETLSREAADKEWNLLQQEALGQAALPDWVPSFEELPPPPEYLLQYGSDGEEKEEEKEDEPLVLTRQSEKIPEISCLENVAFRDEKKATTRRKEQSELWDDDLMKQASNKA